MLVEALDALGDRPAAVARELTKLHEEVIRGRLSELPAMLDAATLKGEVVVVIGGADAAATPDADALVEEARALVAEGTRARDAAKAVADASRRLGQRDLPRPARSAFRLV